MEIKTSELSGSDRLLSAAEKLRNDMLFRARRDSDGVKVVEASHSIWLEFNEAIDSLAVPDELEG